MLLSPDLAQRLQDHTASSKWGLPPQEDIMQLLEEYEKVRNKADIARQIGIKYGRFDSWIKQARRLRKGETVKRFVKAERVIVYGPDSEMAQRTEALRLAHAGNVKLAKADYPHLSYFEISDSMRKKGLWP